MTAIRVSVVTMLLAFSALVQQTQSESPSVVRAGAPALFGDAGDAAAAFLQGCQVYAGNDHAHAVEMTDLIEARTENKKVRLLSSRITKSQADEIEFMRRWLTTRGEKTETALLDQNASHLHSGHSTFEQMTMPGMLTPAQMSELKKAVGAEFDRLFLTGMIQHHNGALMMFKDLFQTAGAGQDAELFNFARDVDTSQWAEIALMRNILGEKGVH